MAKKTPHEPEESIEKVLKSPVHISLDERGEKVRRNLLLFGMVGGIVKSCGRGDVSSGGLGDSVDEFDALNELVDSR